MRYKGSDKVEADYREFGTLLSSPACTIAQYIRYVELDRPLALFFDTGEHLLWLVRLQNLVTLRIDGMPEYQRTAFNTLGPSISPLSSLKSLTIRRVGFVDLSVFMSTLSALPQLHDLSLYAIYTLRHTNQPSTDALLEANRHVLPNLRRLRCYIHRDLQRPFFALLAALPRPPPIAYLDIPMAAPSTGDTPLYTDFLCAISPTLTALRLDPSDQGAFLELADGAPLDLATLEHLHSVTIELVLLTSPYLRRMAQRVTNLLLCALQPPALQKLALSFNILLKSPDLLRYMVEGDVLDGRMEQLPSLQQVKFIFSIPSDFAQMPALHRDIEQLIRGLLPKASARGVLQLRVLKPYTTIESADAGL
ncbi:hypothetical protein GGF50DRAFT_121250 [Schizophyllum commune]